VEYLHSGLSYKRLEKGRFRWPETDSRETKMVLTPEELTLLLGGIDLLQTKRRGWHRMMPLVETNNLHQNDVNE
jgi:transposase